jgi:hypothetical protein
MISIEQIIHDTVVAYVDWLIHKRSVEGTAGRSDERYLFTILYRWCRKFIYIINK